MSILKECSSHTFLVLIFILLNYYYLKVIDLYYKFVSYKLAMNRTKKIRLRIYFYIYLSWIIFCRSVIDSLQKCQLMWKFPTANYSQSMFCISSMCQVYVAPLINLWRLQILCDSMFA